MARKCKTPAKLLALIERHQGTMRHIDEVLRVKRMVPVENQANHIREKSEDYWIGLAHGHSAMLETALFEHNCYAGFHYVGSTPVVLDEDTSFLPSVGLEHPEYAAWRVSYLTRQ